VAVGAVAACSFSGAPRWQLRWVSLFAARLALRQAVASDDAKYHVDVKGAREKVQSTLTLLRPDVSSSSDVQSFGAFEAFGESPSKPSAVDKDAKKTAAVDLKYDDVCDFASLHIESIISTACSAATFILGDDLGLNVLQRLGLLFLGDVVAKFALSTDPDVLEEEGSLDESILMQFTSQINSSIRPSLSLHDAPR
jgi:hypothetical protein